MLRIYYLKLDDRFQSSFSEVMSKKYTDIPSKKISNFAWYTLENILLSDFNLKITDSSIYFSEYGKPYLKDNNLYFNISHCSPYILIGISDSEVGVDIEEEIKIEKADLIIKRFDNNIIKEYNEKENKVKYFTKTWVKAEAYGKMKGIGLRFDIEIPKDLKFNFEEFIDNESGIKYYICVVNKNKERERVEKYVL